MEEYIAKFYLIQTDSKVLKMLNIFEIVDHLENNSLKSNSYIFDLRITRWIKVKEIGVLIDTNYSFKESAEFEKPTFTPPHKLPTNYAMESENSDYIYLRDKLKLRSVNTSETLQLENTIIELNKTIVDLDSTNVTSSEIAFDLESMITDLKVDSNENTQRINLLEKEILEKEIALKEFKEKGNEEFRNYKVEHEDSIIISKELRSKTESLTYTIRSLKFALRVEKEKYDDLKSVISSINEKKEGDTVKDKVIEQAFNYFIQGPVGDGITGLEIEKLEKKVKFLEEELIEKENIYKSKITSNSSNLSEDKEMYRNKITDLEKDYQMKLSSLSSNSAEEKEMYRNKVTDLEKRYQIKITDLGNDKRELRARINILESDLERSYEKSDALLNTVSTSSVETQSDSEIELRYSELKDRFEKSIQNYEQMLAHKESKIKDLLSNVGENEQGADYKTTKYLKEEIVKYKKISENSVKETDILKHQIQKLSTQRVELGNKVKTQQDLLSQYKDVNQKLVSQAEELKKTSASYKDEYKKLFDKNNKAVKKIQSQSSKIDTLNTEKETGLVQSQKEVDDLVNQMLDFKAEAQREKKKAIQLETDLTTLKEQEKKIELADSNNTQNSASEDELNRLIGDSYEVENDSIWTVQFEDGMKTGPHSYSVVYDMKESGEISNSTRVKKTGDGFKSCGDIFELSTRVFIHGEGEERRFFIKRNSVRVPYYDLVTFEIDGKEVKGYCTSISSGGIFIELTSVKKEDFKNNAKGRLLFPKGALENPFNCIAQIKNISLDRPKGIGLMFIDLPENAGSEILTFVNSYLNQTKKSA